MASRTCRNSKPILASGGEGTLLMGMQYPRPCNSCQCKYCSSNEMLHRGNLQGRGGWSAEPAFAYQRCVVSLSIHASCATNELPAVRRAWFDRLTTNGIWGGASVTGARD